MVDCFWKIGVRKFRVQSCSSLSRIRTTVVFSEMSGRKRCPFSIEIVFNLKDILVFQFKVVSGISLLGGIDRLIWLFKEWWRIKDLGFEIFRNDCIVRIIGSPEQSELVGCRFHVW